MTDFQSETTIGKLRISAILPWSHLYPRERPGAFITQNTAVKIKGSGETGKNSIPPFPHAISIFVFTPLHAIQLFWTRLSSPNSNFLDPPSHFCPSPAPPYDLKLNSSKETLVRNLTGPSIFWIPVLASNSFNNSFQPLHFHNNFKTFPTFVFFLDFIENTLKVKSSKLHTN